jgi:hypothetical protein
MNRDRQAVAVNNGDGNDVKNGLKNAKHISVWKFTKGSNERGRSKTLRRVARHKVQG